MLHGDISNRKAPTVGFRVDGNLLHFKENNLLDRVANLFIKDRFEVDNDVLRAIEYIYMRTDMTVDLIMDSKYYSDAVVDYLASNVPYSSLKLITKPVEVSIMLNIKDIIYYVDNDTERLSIIGNKGCITLETFDMLFR